MFPSYGLFKSYLCPDDCSNCNRPYCPFHHAKIRKKEIIDIKNSLNSTDDITTKFSSTISSKSDASQTCSRSLSAEEEFNFDSSSAATTHKLINEKTTSSIDEKEVLQKLISDAVKKAIAESSSSLNISNLDHSSIIKNLDANSLIAKAVLEVTKTSKTVDGISGKSKIRKEPPKLYLPPPGTPNYMPTPISELKRKKLPIHDPNIQTNDEEYTPTSIVHNSPKEISLSRDLGEDGEITDFSSSDNEEYDKSDFDMLEEVLAEHSSNPIRNKEIQKRKKALNKNVLRELPTTLSLQPMENKQLVEKDKDEKNEKSIVECKENSFLPPSPLFTCSNEPILEHNVLNNENSTSNCLKATTDNDVNKDLSVQDGSINKSHISDENTNSKIDTGNCSEERDALPPVNKHTFVSQIATLTRPNTKVWTPIAKPQVKEHNLQSVEMMLEQLDSFSCVTDAVTTSELSTNKIIDQKESCNEQSVILNDEKGNSAKEDTLTEDSGAKSSSLDSNLSEKEVGLNEKKKNRKRNRSGSSYCSSVERGHSRKKKRKKTHKKDSKSKKRRRKELSSDSESYSTESEEESNRHSRSKSKRNKHKSHHYRKKKGHKHKKRKDKRKRSRSSDKKHSDNSNTDSNSKEESYNSEGTLPIDPACIKKEKEEDLDVFIVKIEKPDKVPNLKIDFDKVSSPREKLSDSSTQVTQNLSKFPDKISSKICDTQKENNSDSSKTNSKLALKKSDEKPSTKNLLQPKIKSDVNRSKDISSKSKLQPRATIGQKYGEGVHDKDILDKNKRRDGIHDKDILEKNKNCSLNNTNNLVSKYIEPHEIKIEKCGVSTLSISSDVPKFSMFDVVTAKLEQISKPKILTEISLFDSLLDSNSQVKNKIMNISNPTSNRKSSETASNRLSSTKKIESNIQESLLSNINKKNSESSIKEKHDTKYSNHNDSKSKIKNNHNSDKYKLGNAANKEVRSTISNPNVLRERDKSRPSNKVKKDCESTKSSQNLKMKEGESTKSSHSGKKKDGDVKINAEYSKSRTKSKTEIEKSMKDERHSKHSHHGSKREKRDSTTLSSLRDVSDSPQKRSSSSGSHRKHSSSTNVPHIENTKRDSKRRHSQSSRKSSSSIVSNNEDISDGFDSPIPDLSALDELPKEDWDQLLSCNKPDSFIDRKESASDSDDGIDYEPNFDLDENVDGTEDANDPKVVEECLKLFSEFDSDNVSQPFKKMKVETLDLKEEPDDDVTVQKQRVARTGASGNLLSTPKPLVRPHRKTPTEVMLERYQKLKEEEKALQKKLELQRKALEQHAKTPYSVLSSTSSISNSSVSSSSDCKSAMLSSPVSSSTIGVSKKRIARAPSNVEAMLRSKAEIKKRHKENSVEVSTSSVPKSTVATIAMTSTKGSKRVAHVPTPEVLVRPTVNIENGTKVPQNIRQRYLNCFIDEASKFCEDTNQAYKVALAEEKVCHQRASTRMVYLNLAVNIIKKLRSFQISEAAQELLNVDPEFDSVKESSPKVSSSSSQVFSHPINPNHRVVSHLEVISAGGNKGTWSIQKSKKPLIADLKELLSGPKFSKCLQKYVLTVEQLEENGFPRPDPTHKGKALIKKPNSRKKISPTETKRYCDRCSVLYEVDPWGIPLSMGPCVYHWGRPYKKRAIGGGLETKYSCCQGDNQADGCCMGTTHVSENFSPDFLKGYVRTLPKEPKRDGDYGVYALDCEMCYTTSGNELTRITVIDINKKAVYETLVLPDNPIIDYNTRFSGITVEQMEGVRVSLRDVQATLLTLFSDKTILMGHSLESDFAALKLIHDTVVDTSVVFPHKLGAPYKRALRNLASEILTKIIQNDVAGHDSAEDAITCLELMQWKVQDDFKILTLQKN